MKQIITTFLISVFFLLQMNAQVCPTKVRVLNAGILAMDFASFAERDAAWAALTATGIVVNGDVTSPADPTDISRTFTKAQLRTADANGGTVARIRSENGEEYPSDPPNDVNGDFTGMITFDYADGAVVCNYATSVLPITLTDFTAKSEKNAVRLNWETVSEFNNDYMLIERSIDGRNFTEIGSVRGAGTTDKLQRYSLADLNPIRGTNYYRICQVDFDGTKSFSYTVVATVEKEVKVDLVILPTLVQNHPFITIDLSSIEPTNSILEIINISGQVVATYQVNSGNGREEIPVADLANGAYLIRTITSGHLMTGRFMKVN